MKSPGEHEDHELVDQLRTAYVRGAAPILGRRVRQALDGITTDTMGVVASVFNSPEGRELQRRARALDDAAGGVLRKGLQAFADVLRKPEK